MTEFEIANLAVRHAALTAVYVQAAVAGTVGLIQAGLITWGLLLMRRAGDQREKREDARHAESMEALRALIHGMETVIERTGKG